MFLRYKGLSEQAFRMRVGWSQGLLGKAIKEGRAIGGDKLANVLRVFPELDPGWLMLGEGRMIRAPDTEQRLTMAAEPLAVQRAMPSTLRKAMSQEEQAEQMARLLQQMKEMQQRLAEIEKGRDNG